MERRSKFGQRGNNTSRYVYKCSCFKGVPFANTNPRLISEDTKAGMISNKRIADRQKTLEALATVTF